MPLDPNRLERPLDKLSKSLKKFPKQPSPEQVHDVRTRARRVEATLHALMLDRKRKGRRALKAVAPVRSRAGKVRDMDVLTGFASTLSGDSDHECLVELLEHLGHQRFRGARKLHKVAVQQSGVARRSLKRCSSTIKRNFDGTKGRSRWPADAAAMALQLSGELAKGPKLNRQNLHPFRLKVKELRYVLELSGEKGEFVDALGKVKDKIGEWHDWTELAVIAEDLLQHPGHCDVLEQIQTGAERRFDDALALANRLRQQYLQPSRTKNKRTGSEKRAKEPVLTATAKLAA